MPSADMSSMRYGAQKSIAGANSMFSLAALIAVPIWFVLLYTSVRLASYAYFQSKHQFFKLRIQEGLEQW